MRISVCGARDRERMKYIELKKHIEDCLNGAKSFEPMYVVGGADAYLRGTAVAMFKSIVDTEYADFNLSVISHGQGVSSAIDALSLFPMFDERKVVIIPDFPSKINDQERAQILAYLSSPNPASIFVIVAEDAQSKNDGKESSQDDDEKKGKGESGKTIASFIKEAKLTLVDCAKLDENIVAVELEGILKEHPAKSIEPRALHALIEKTLGDMSRIVCEVKKLKAYSENTITLADVEAMVAPDLDFAIFAFASAVSEQQPEKALEIVATFFKQGIRGDTLIALLYGQYRKMLHAELHKNDDNAQVASMLGISDKQLYHVKRVSKNYTQVRLKQAVDYLHNLQYAIRSGKRIDTTAVHDAVLTLLNI